MQFLALNSVEMITSTAIKSILTCNSNQTELEQLGLSAGDGTNYVNSDGTRRAKQLAMRAVRPTPNSSLRSPRQKSVNPAAI